MKKNIIEFYKRLVYRHQKKISIYRYFRSGLKGLVAIMVLAMTTHVTGFPLLMAPFGASAILIFTTPRDEYAQPVNVFGGYVLSGITSIFLLDILPDDWWTVALMVGTCIILMAMFRVTHPPAGAVPIIIYFSKDIVDFWFLFFPILDGTVILLITALILHRIPPVREYPRKLPD